jgi:hypothetical protein
MKVVDRECTVNAATRRRSNVVKHERGVIRDIVVSRTRRRTGVKNVVPRPARLGSTPIRPVHVSENVGATTAPQRVGRRPHQTLG